MAARVGRPSGESGAIAVREGEEEGPFVRLALQGIPEGFRMPVLRALTRMIPDPGQALTDAVEDLCRKPDGGDHPSTYRSTPGPTKAQIERVRDLADLHILRGDPIPPEAQTKFFRFLSSYMSCWRKNSWESWCETRFSNSICFLRYEEVISSHSQSCVS